MQIIMGSSIFDRPESSGISDATFVFRIFDADEADAENDGVDAVDGLVDEFHLD